MICRLDALDAAGSAIRPAGLCEVSAGEIRSPLSETRSRELIVWLGAGAGHSFQALKKSIFHWSGGKDDTVRVQG